ncbi:hypothetical protein AVEN_233547-1 [Araneus ventricosus]|uniref:Endonuclease/exonuclease/phosphatase domain-containing protein n=1 Tax=Araneus ventricosus TaxID=182803 RepID=A0A4Y2NC88_ARAVE|nr:hypothetical protein AVEN_233547-1 [Araneus ventricosus]
MGPLVSWNCRGIRTKLVDVKALVTSLHPVCVALQETFLKPIAHLKLRGYNCVRKDNDTGTSSGGVCLLTFNLFPSTTLNLPHLCRLWLCRYPTTENLIAFKRARANARRIRRRSQRESWIRFLSSITSNTSSADLWTKVKAASGIYKEFTFPVINTGTGSYSSPLDVANTIGESFADISSSSSYNPHFLAIKRRTEQIHLNFNTRRSLSYNCKFRMFELEKALSQTRVTSPGPDGITYNMLLHLDANLLFHLLRLFNRIWSEQSFPAQWYEAVVVPILKPGKTPTNPFNYRPIALTSCLCKTFERMVNARLLY